MITIRKKDSLELPLHSIEKNSNDKIYVKVLQSSVNTLIYILLGCILVIDMWFIFNGEPLTQFRLHILFCVLGYQLLMAVAILSLSTANNWSIPLSRKHRLRAHWILQLLGSALGIIGSALEINNKTVHFNTVHGKLGIIAIAFTCVSLVNGVTSLYATELKRYIPPQVSKISHILFGTAAFACTGACLYYGCKKRSFTNWAPMEIVYLMMTVTAVYTTLIVLIPCWTMVHRIYNLIRK